MVCGTDAGLRVTLPFFGLRPLAAYAVALTGRALTDTQANPTQAEVGFRLATDGKIYQRTSFGGAYSEIVGLEWLFPHDASEADRYECFANLDSGSVSTGTTGSWLALSSNQDWTRVRSSNGTSAAQLTISIRLVGTANALASAIITLTATMVP